MSTTKTAAADADHWVVLLPTGDTCLWDGVTMPMVKLGKAMIAATDGRLINPSQVVSLTPPRGAA